MSEDRYPYDVWVNEALQGVLHRALTTLANEGFNGDHHMFISFDTNHPDVRLPGFLRAQYPDEITIVLQHQFEDLMVADELFQVSLSFNGQKHRLTVPFVAVRSFADPSVNFGLQINQPAGQTTLQPSPIPVGPRTRGSVPETRPRTQLSDAKSHSNLPDAVPAAKTAGSTGRERPAATAGSAEVITLDAFRKK